MTRSLYSLREACAEFFGDDGPSVSALRTEAKKGNLELIRIAGKDYITAAAISAMVKKCRIQRNPQGSISGNAKAESPHGLSLAERRKSAQLALSTITQELKKPSRNGLPTTKGRTHQNVVSMKSR
jgi:hypothetical protein